MPYTSELRHLERDVSADGKGTTDGRADLDADLSSAIADTFGGDSEAESAVAYKETISRTTACVGELMQTAWHLYGGFGPAAFRELRTENGELRVKK